MFDALISTIENVNLHKKYSKKNSITIEYHQPVQNVVFQVQMWLPHSWNVVYNNGTMTSQ